ncbi:MAG: SsrA-binding protein SmpB [Defluviitaleaceae bacterium]|nr:SsrA-binding protein SmpB [Defluviitaleaceae bacterium]
MTKGKEGIKILAQNKKAYHDYFINETYQAGIELVGTEVKSLRAGRCNLKDSFVRIEGGEAFVYGMHISPYEHGNIFNKDPVRKRRLLLHKFEIKKLQEALSQDGLTIVPTRIYLKGSLVKIDIAAAKGKKLHDKRHAIAEKDVKREAQKEFKIRNLG